jgi:hypothetical protein
MEESAFLTGVLAGVAYAIASARLLWLARRTHEMPELYLSIYFAGTAAWYLIYNSPNYPGFDDELSASTVVVANWIYVVCVIPYLLFIRDVFRPAQAWAQAIVWLCTFCLIAGAIHATVQGELAEVIHNPWFLLEWFGYATPAAWMCVESARVYRGAKKRARIGLCDPVTANRYLIFAWFGCFQTLAVLAGLYWAMDNEEGAISTFADRLLGSVEVAGVATLWLAFFPPRGYQGWIRRRAVVLPTPMDG